MNNTGGVVCSCNSNCCGSLRLHDPAETGANWEPVVLMTARHGFLVSAAGPNTEGTGGHPLHRLVQKLYGLDQRRRSGLILRSPGSCISHLSMGFSPRRVLPELMIFNAMSGSCSRAASATRS